MTIFAVTTSVTDKNGQQASSTGGSVTPGSSGSPTAVSIGQTTILGTADGGNANLLIAQPVTLAQAATIESLSFYVRAVGGLLRLGIYSDSAGPKTKLAETNAFTPAAGWNTQVVVSPVLLQPGTYWIAYLPSSNSLGFFNNGTNAGAKLASFAFGVMPSTFPANPGAAALFLFYATFLQGAVAVPTVWVNSDIPPPPPPTGFQVVLSKASLSNMGAQNKGAVIGALTVINGTQTTPITVGGADAAKFAVTNGGMVPCNLIAAIDIPAGSYSITLTVT